MSDRSLSSTTLRFGVILGIAGVVLVILGPFINQNFGVGSSWESTSQLLGDAPVGLAVSTLYSVLVQFCVPFSAALVGASLVMRHNEALRKIGNHGEAETPNS